MKAILVVVATAAVLASGMGFAQSGADVAKAKGCLNCHDMDKKKVGPAIKDIAAKQKDNKDAIGAMSAKLKEVLAAVDETKYDAVLLGYALCSNGLVGLTAGKIPLVLPRAHDCITLFLGSKERYLDYFQAHTGVYFKTSGWIERGEGLMQYREDSLFRSHAGFGAILQLPPRTSIAGCGHLRS